MTAAKQEKCKLKDCLNVEKGRCSLAAPFNKRIKANSIKCPYFDNDFQKTWNEYKNKGGTLGAIAKMKGKKTETELKEIKSKKRKTRSDKNKKRSPKKETALNDFME